MAFIDLVQQLAHDPSSANAPAVERAVELRGQLSVDPNNTAAFDELASIIRKLGNDRTLEDPLTADAVETDETSPDLVLWSLAEDLGSDSRAWYPLVMLASLAINDDVDSAVRHLETAADRDESGEALAKGVKLLREHEYNGLAEQLGLGRWNSSTHTTDVGVEITRAAIADGKEANAARYIEHLKDAGADESVVSDLEAQLPQD